MSANQQSVKMKDSVSTYPETFNAVVVKGLADHSVRMVKHNHCYQMFNSVF